MPFFTFPAFNAFGMEAPMETGVILPILAVEGGMVGGPGVASGSAFFAFAAVAGLGGIFTGLFTILTFTIRNERTWQ